MKRCEACNNPLGEQTPEGFKVRLENHSEQFIKSGNNSYLRIRCQCGTINYIKEEA